MAAVGGDTIIPTNWTGLIVTLLIVGAIAAATYFGLDLKFGQEKAVEVEDKVSLQEIFSANSSRLIQMADTARVSTRAALPAPSPTVAQTDPDPDPMEDSVAADLAPPPEPAPAPTPEPKPKTTPAPVAKAPAPGARSAPKPAPVIDAQQKPPADAINAWWAESEGSLSLRYAGALDRGDQPSNAIALMFSEPVDPGALSSHVIVSDQSGKVMGGVWKAARNPNMLYLEGVETGRYTLIVKRGLSARTGNALNSDLAGPVYIY